MMAFGVYADSFLKIVTAAYIRGFVGEACGKETTWKTYTYMRG
jgi:hypothetical protein